MNPLLLDLVSLTMQTIATLDTALETAPGDDARRAAQLALTQAWMQLYSLKYNPIPVEPEPVAVDVDTCPF